MESADVKRLALVLAIQAEIEGMKAENTNRGLNGNSLAYTEDWFELKARELRTLVNLKIE